VVKIHFLGTCAGTEPQPGRRHSSLVLEYDGRLFWFDAGESCAYTAHLMGLDLLNTEAVFISHPHMDHIGGLPHLIWTVKKLETRTKLDAVHRIELHLPAVEIWQGIEKMLFLKGRRLHDGISFTVKQIKDGVVYEQGGLKVTAFHNHHITRSEAGEPWLSFSFLIELEGKRIIYSGDFKTMADLDPLFEVGPVDLLIVETGHHTVENICAYLVNNNIKTARIGFTHHGRAILANPEQELKKAKAIFGDQVFFAEDKMTVTP